MKRLVTIIVLLVSTLWSGAPVGAQDPEIEGLPDRVEEAKVSSYVDGDKIKVALDGERVELNFIGADAPEPKECYVAESNAAMKKLLPKGTVLYLESDAITTDSKGRVLRHVWAEGKGGKAYLVNAKLIRDGIAGWKAKDAEDGNAKYADRYEKAEADAKKSKNGLWAECDRLHSKARTKSAQRESAKQATEAAASAPEPTQVPPDASESDYLAELQADHAALIQSFTDFEVLIANPDPTSETVFLVAAVFVTWQATYDEWQGRDAPSGFEQIDSEWKLRLSLLNTAADQLIEGIDNQDQDRIDEGALNYYAGKSLIEGISDRIYG